jgi:molybdate-binding protein/DNA-binding XRE family transcriptional regulator
MMSTERPLPNRVKQFREQLGWSQDQLAGKTGISRAAVSAIEIQRVVPSVAAALALAGAFGCRVEDLFGMDRGESTETIWAWPPLEDPCRYWHARVGGRILHFPSEPTVAGILPHDGVFQSGQLQPSREVKPEQTLVLASCDPAASLLATEYERTTGFRLLPLHRSSRAALDLLRQGLVDVAGVHLATSENESGNALKAKAVLGDGFSLLRFATWEEGLAVKSSISTSSVHALLRSKLQWIGRERGAAARECQDEILGDRRGPRRVVNDHRSVAAAIRCGWADVGVCLRLVCAEAGLKFIKVREEAYDLCFPTSIESDPRVRKLIGVIRSPALRTLYEALPGYRVSRNSDDGRM